MTRNLVNRVLLGILVRALGCPAGARLVGGTGRRKKVIHKMWGRPQKKATGLALRLGAELEAGVSATDL